MNPYYFDYAAATPIDPSVIMAMQPFFSQSFYNPSANYSAAVVVRKQVEAARSAVAQTLGCRPAEIVFTAGGSEANNLAIHGVMRQYPDATMLISSIEHDSVRYVADTYSSTEILVDEHGILRIDDLRQKVDDKVVLVSVMYANNEIGTIQPIREIAAVITEVRKDRRTRGVLTPLYLHCDAAQAANFLDLQVARLGVDMLSLNGGKIYGPKQTGCLFVKGGLRLEPLIAGGGQERGLRSGTENVPGIIGFATALGQAQNHRHDESKRLTDLQRHFLQQVRDKLPRAIVHGSLKKRLPNNVHLGFPGVDNERLLFELDEIGFMAAAGSACSASKEESSHVLHALGLSDDEARSSLRFTMGRGTTVDAIDKLIAALERLTA